MSESITGYIDHIIFRNEDNGYTVMVLKGVSEEDELTCVGSFPVVTQGASVELEGNFTQHPVYGKQFQAVRLTEKCRKMHWQWKDTSVRVRLKELARHWREGSYVILEMIRFR